MKISERQFLAINPEDSNKFCYFWFCLALGVGS